MDTKCGGFYTTKYGGIMKNYHRIIGMEEGLSGYTRIHLKMYKVVQRDVIHDDLGQPEDAPFFFLVI
jgi:hypothetical protein